MEYLLFQQWFLVERLKEWRSSQEIIELSDLLAEIAAKIARQRQAC